MMESVASETTGQKSWHQIICNIYGESGPWRIWSESVMTVNEKQDGWNLVGLAQKIIFKIAPQNSPPVS
jgi:hypothetical protein